MQQVNSSVILCVLCAFACHYCTAQEPVFSQHFASPLTTNPAFTGTAYKRLVLNNRLQWSSFNGQLLTNAFSYDMQVPGIRSGIGLTVLYDRAGKNTSFSDSYLNTFNCSAAYSYFIVTEGSFSVAAALQGGIIQKSIDYDKALFYEQIQNPGSGFGASGKPPITRSSRLMADVSSGIVLYSNETSAGFSKYVAGFAVHNLTEPNQSFYNTDKKDGSELPRRFTAHGAVNLSLSGNKEKEGWSLNPNFILVTQKRFTQLTPGINLNYAYNGEKLSAAVMGLKARFAANKTSGTDALIVLFGFRTEHIKIGYSFDFTIADINGTARNSHELSLAYTFTGAGKTKKTKDKDIPVLYTGF